MLQRYQSNLMHIYDCFFSIFTIVFSAVAGGVSC